eukprot:4769602-Pyramimonas_sp.AAC.1
MQGPWTPRSKLFQRGAASEGWAEGAMMQGGPWEACPSLQCGLTVGDKWAIKGRRAPPTLQKRVTREMAKATLAAA